MSNDEFEKIKTAAMLEHFCLDNIDERCDVDVDDLEEFNEKWKILKKKSGGKKILQEVWVENGSYETTQNILDIINTHENTKYKLIDAENY
jgi:hypothetical protein